MLPRRSKINTSNSFSPRAPSRITHNRAVSNPVSNTKRPNSPPTFNFRKIRARMETIQNSCQVGTYHLKALTSVTTNMKNLLQKRHASSKLTLTKALKKCTIRLKLTKIKTTSCGRSKTKIRRAKVVLSPSKGC